MRPPRNEPRPPALADAQEPQAVEPVGEVLEAVHLPARQPLDRRQLGGQRPEVVERNVAAVRQTADAAFTALDDDGLAGGFDPRLSPGREGQGEEGIRGNREDERLAGFREADDEVPALDLEDLAGPELGIEAVGQAVSGLPHAWRIVCGAQSSPYLPAMVTLLCPVRDCGEPLRKEPRAWVCPRGHSFDIARSGYCNLLQPQDSRSRNPGDPREAALARRRFLEAGHGNLLLQALSEMVPERSAILDVGCGEGFFLGSLAAQKEIEAHGIDLSVPAIDLASRRYPDVSWWVVNADRRLPFADGSFDLAMSLTARRNPPEVRRVLSPAGRLLVAIPGEDDLIELREAVLGEGIVRSRLDRTVEELAGAFELESHQTLWHKARLDAAAIQDALASTYRGARESRQRRLEGLDELEVTLSLDLASFRPRPGPQAYL